MKLNVLSSLLLCSPALAQDFTYERLNVNDSLLLIVDHQVGLFGLARDEDAVTFRNAMYAHADLGRTFNLPVIMTTSAQDGPNGPLPGEFLEWYPEAPVIQRHGEVNAWDNEEFREAVTAANKSQIIIAGIVTDVCTTFLALSLRDAGYSVWANHEASSTGTTYIRDMANDRMRAAGVQVVSLFAIVCELMRDWRNTPGGLEVWPFLDRYAPAGGMVARAHRGAVNDGVVPEGVIPLP